jgi:glutamyl-tRNA reductase
VPRNIDASVKEVGDAYLYDVDDLEQVAERGRAERCSALAPAEAILALELEQFERWQAGRRVVPTIRELREHARSVALAEAKRTLARLPDASEPTRVAVERMAEAIVAKLLHRPLDQLRAEAAEGETSYYAEAVREIFGLEEEEE